MQLTADAAYADLVLPAATFFEIESYMVYGPIFRIHERILWIVTSTLMIIGCVGFLIAWNLYLGLFTILSLPCYAALLFVMRGPLAHAAFKARRKLSHQNGIMLDLLAGAHDIRFYQQAEPGARRFRAAAEDYTCANIRVVRINDWAMAANEMFSEIVTFMPFLMGGYLICLSIGTLSVGILVAYNIYLVNVMAALAQLMAGLTCLSRAEPLLRRIIEILEAHYGYSIRSGSIWLKGPLWYSTVGQPIEWKRSIREWRKRREEGCSTYSLSLLSRKNL